MNESYKLNQEIFDLALYHALENNAETEDAKNAALLDQYMEAPAFQTSKKYQKNIEYLIKRSQSLTNGKTFDFRRWISEHKLIPVVVSIFIFVLIPFTAKASIIDFFEWAFNYTSEYMSMDEIGKMQNQCIVELVGKDQWKYFYFPQNIPEGFVLEKVESSMKKCNLIFQESDQDNYFSVRQFRLTSNELPQEFSGLYDNKEIEKGKSIVVDGNEAIWIKKNNIDIIAFDNNDYYFEFLFNGISKSDVKKICAGLRKVSLNQEGSQ